MVFSCSILKNIDSFSCKRIYGSFMGREIKFSSQLHLPKNLCLPKSMVFQHNQTVVEYAVHIFITGPNVM